MDTLALLCTLHADGPASLQRLRAAELSSIDDILGCSVEMTADVLGLSMAQARRFHREARILAMRMDTEGLDREERMYPGSAGVEAPLNQPVAQVSMTTQPASTTSTMSQPEPGRECADDMREKPDIAAILAPVMERWKEEDLKNAATMEEPTTTSAGEIMAANSCTPDVLDGVDQPLRDALRAAGYATLTSLAEVEPLELSRATGRTYSEACRVSFLAKRALEEGTQRAAEPAKAEKTGPATSSALEESSEKDPENLVNAERVLRELTGNMELSGERFSPAAPERGLPQDPLADMREEEGPGGPFA